MSEEKQLKKSIKGDVEVTERKAKKNQNDELMAMLQGISEGMSSITEDVSKLAKRVDNIETGGVNKFKDEARAEDVEVARETRAGLDPKISQIVDELLGEDFGAELKPMGDRPGFRFSVIVPQRLSDNKPSTRPVVDPETGKYKKNEAGDTLYEDYYPEDRRSRVVASGDSYDTVKKHCEMVRANIVSYYQKMSMPIPEFKVR